MNYYKRLELYRTAWDRLKGPEFAIVDDQGKRMAKASVKKAKLGYWLYQDRNDGFSLKSSMEISLMNRKAIRK